MRTAILVSSLFALSALAGCTASTQTDDAAQATGEDALISRPAIELTGSSDPASVQGKLFKLLSTFKDDADLEISSGIDSPAFFMKGAKEPKVSVRSLVCSESHLIHATVGVGVSNTSIHECTLDGFDRNRAGGSLPAVVLGQGEEPLAGKLFTLLSKGEKKGGLGVKRTSSTAPTPCCDMISTTSFEISDAAATLSCSLHSGGIAGISRAECTFARKIAATE